MTAGLTSVKIKDVFCQVKVESMEKLSSKIKECLKMIEEKFRGLIPCLIVYES